MKIYNLMSIFSRFGNHHLWKTSTVRHSWELHVGLIGCHPRFSLERFRTFYRIVLATVARPRFFGCSMPAIVFFFDFPLWLIFDGDRWGNSRDMKIVTIVLSNLNILNYFRMTTKNLEILSFPKYFLNLERFKISDGSHWEPSEILNRSK